jgi:hypothetical protein
MLMSKLARFGRVVSVAQKRILDFLKEGGDDNEGSGRRSREIDKCYVSISWGKDSTVLLHLVASLFGIDATRAISIQYGTPGLEGWTISKFDRWPDLVNVRDSFLSCYPVDYNEAFVESWWYLCEKFGCTPVANDMAGGGENISLIEKMLIRSFEIAIDARAAELGCTHNLMGMRKEESNNRQRHFAMRGHTYFNKSRGFWCCNPLYDWKGNDIWAYIVKYDLPYSELYDLQGGDRNTLRNGLMIGGGQARFGNFALFKKLYPSLWNEVCVTYPWLRAWSG